MLDRGEHIRGPLAEGWGRGRVESRNRAVSHPHTIIYT